jgi:ABC-type antimicrobial peptide transport system permease subunit
LRSVDPNLIVGDLRTFSDQVAHNFDQDRLLAGLSGLFAVLALLLASVGLYGVTVYLVACRTSEIGVRSALGASRWQIISLILRRVGWQTGLGLAVGIPAALGGVRLLGSQVYGVSGYDPRYLAAAALVLVVCAALAGFLPARRAAAIDPARTLRAD